MRVYLYWSPKSVIKSGDPVTKSILIRNIEGTLIFICHTCILTNFSDLIWEKASWYRNNRLHKNLEKPENSDSYLDPKDYENLILVLFPSAWITKLKQVYIQQWIVQSRVREKEKHVFQ